MRTEVPQLKLHSGRIADKPVAAQHSGQGALDRTHLAADDIALLGRGRTRLTSDRAWPPRRWVVERRPARQPSAEASWRPYTGLMCAVGLHKVVHRLVRRPPEASGVYPQKQPACLSICPFCTRLYTERSSIIPSICGVHEDPGAGHRVHESTCARMPPYADSASSYPQTRQRCASAGRRTCRRRTSRLRSRSRLTRQRLRVAASAQHRRLRIRRAQFQRSGDPSCELLRPSCPTRGKGQRRCPRCQSRSTDRGEQLFWLRRIERGLCGEEAQEVPLRS